MIFILYKLYILTPYPTSKNIFYIFEKKKEKKII